MTKIISKSFFLCLATLAAMACQPVDDEPDDTDTAPECGEDETAVVAWCEDAYRMINDLWCVQCGDEYACENKEWLDFVCDILSSNYGKLADCVNKEDAAHCQAELARTACDSKSYWWEECDGFTE